VSQETLQSRSDGSLAEARLGGGQHGLGVAGFGLPRCHIDMVQNGLLFRLSGWPQYPSRGATRHGLAGFALAFAQRRRGSNYVLGGAGAIMTVGGCQCGDVRYEISGDPLALYICHCRECQKQSASAFGMSLQVKRADFRITRGAARSWSRSTDSGNRLKCFFCPRCGSRICTRVPLP
jgi:Glutathione-dependent formaldehyde-activating enzyme